MIRPVLLLVAAFLQLAASQRLQEERSCDRRTEVWNRKCNAHCEPICGEGDLVPCSRSSGSFGEDADVGFNQRICRAACNCKPRYIRAHRGGPCIPKSECRDGPVPGGNGPVPGGNGPVPGGNGPIPGGNGPVPGGNGPVPGGNGPVPGGNGPVPGGNGNSRCGPNQVYKDCGSACPEFCNQPQSLPCTSQCVQGCFCKPGFVQQYRGGPCVPRGQCEAAGEECRGRNEEFRSCGSACPAVCGEPPGTVCTSQCVPGCFCKRGFIRQRRNGTCIPVSACRTRHNPVF